MYIVNNETNYSKFEIETLEELIIELNEQNIKNKVKEKEETYTIYKINDDNEIINEITINLPNKENIEDILIELEYEEKEESKYSKEEETLPNLKLKKEQKPIKTYKINQQKIRQQIEQKKEEENRKKQELYEAEKYKKNHEIQSPTNNISYNNTTVYEGTTIISADDLKNQFTIKIDYELEKIEKQIYILEKQGREYRRLKKAINEMNY